MPEWVRGLGDRNPVARPVTDIVLDEIGDGVDGTARNVTFDDQLERSEAGWRISRRTVKARRTPLQP